jgi:hypothetical protein
LKVALLPNPHPPAGTFSRGEKGVSIHTCSPAHLRQLGLQSGDRYVRLAYHAFIAALPACAAYRFIATHSPHFTACIDA